MIASTLIWRPSLQARWPGLRSYWNPLMSQYVCTSTANKLSTCARCCRLGDLHSDCQGRWYEVFPFFPFLFSLGKPEFVPLELKASSRHTRGRDRHTEAGRDPEIFFLLFFFQSLCSRLCSRSSSRLPKSSRPWPMPCSCKWRVYKLNLYLSLSLCLN